MPVISMANPKGGSGKTTTALILATQLAESGASVIIVDADPEQWISQWASLPGRPEGVSVRDGATEDSIIDQIEAASREAQFVIVDLEGTASLMVASAVGMSDLVLIPMQGSSMDARGGAKTLRLIGNQARMVRRDIPHSVVLTRTSAAMRSRALRNVQDQLRENGIDVLQTGLVERAAFRDLLEFGGTLSGLGPEQASNVGKAIRNARKFAGEVIKRLREVTEQV